MITKIMINTPKGHAQDNEVRLRKLIIGVKRKRVTVINNYVNDDDSQFIWEIEGSVKDILRINKNVSRFDSVMRNVLDHKLMKRTIRKKLSDEGEAELKELLKDQTTVDIIKNATAEELVEANITWWQRMKKTYKKV